MKDDFLQAVLEYRNLGLDPLRWVENSLNEKGSIIFYNLLRSDRKPNRLVDYSWCGAYPYSGKNPELIRRVYNIKSPREQGNLRTKRIISLFNLHSDTTSSSRRLSRTLLDFSSKIDPKYSIWCSEISTTSDLNAQFALLDFIDLHRGEKIGYTVVNSSSLKIIDPTQNPESDINTAISLASPLEYLALMGCTSGFRIVPIYDAPNEDMINCIQNGHAAFSSRHNIPVDDYSSLNIRKLFLGGTAFANTAKEIPVRYDLVKAGMVIILTQKFGSLCPLNVRIMKKIYPGFNGFNNLDDNFGPTISNDILKSLSRPRLSLGKIVAKYSPDFGNTFNIDSNIIAVHPVLTDGVISLLHLARLSNSHLLIKDIPMEYEQLALSVTKERLVSNSTSSVNGCHLIVAGNGLADEILRELRKRNFDPVILGEVVDQGKPLVTISKEILNYVAAKFLVNKFEIR